MHKRNEGFAHIGLVLIGLVVVAAIGFAAMRVLSKEGESNSSSTSGSDTEETLVIKNFGLKSLSSVDVTTNALREYSSMGLKGFYPFGDKLDQTRINPNFEFASMKEGTEVIAAIEGEITFIREQPESKDYEVMLQPKDGSAWIIGYDHLVNVKVTKGQKVTVDTVLGTPARQNNGLLRFEIQINKDTAGSTTHYCPSALLGGDLKDFYLEELKVMQNSWNTTSGLTLYDLSAQNPVGCINKTTLTPQEAEGR